MTTKVSSQNSVGLAIGAAGLLVAFLVASGLFTKPATPPTIIVQPNGPTATVTDSKSTTRPQP